MIATLQKEPFIQENCVSEFCIINLNDDDLAVFEEYFWRWMPESDWTILEALP